MKILLGIINVLILLVLFALFIHLLEWLLKPTRNIDQDKVFYPDYKLIGLRQQNAFTQKEAARYLNVSWSGFCDYERGRLYPVPERWFRILEGRIDTKGGK